MAISLTSTYLLVGTSSGAIHLYDLPSHQLVRTISTHKGFSITYLTSFLKPPDLVGHISLDLKVGSMSGARDALPAKPVQPFQRIKDSKTREAHEVNMFLQTKRNVSWFSARFISIKNVSLVPSHTRTMLPNLLRQNSSGITRLLFNLSPIKMYRWGPQVWNLPRPRTGSRNLRLKSLSSENNSEKPRALMM